MVKILTGADLRDKILSNAVLTNTAPDTARELAYDDTGETLRWRTSANAAKKITDHTLSEFATLTADKSLSTYTFTSTKSVFDSNDLVTKAFVQNYVTVGDTKASVKAATAATLTLTTDYTRTGTGATHTLTETGAGTALSIDGVTTWVDIDNDGGSADPFATTPASRVLVKNASDAKDNGIYVVKEKGDVGTPWILIRASDFDGTPSNEVSGGAFTWVEEGTVNADSGWAVSSNGAITVDTNDINFTQTAGSGSVVEGTGINVVGSTVHLDLSSNITALAADDAQTSDRLAIYDNSASTQKYITLGDFITTIEGNGIAANGVVLDLDINGIANTATTIGVADLLAIYDATTDNRIEKITVANFVDAIDGSGIAYNSGVLDLDVNDLTTETTVTVANDYLAFYDASATATRKVTVTGLTTMLFDATNGLATITSGLAGSDQLLIDDGGTPKRMTVSNFASELGELGDIPSMLIFASTTTVASTETFTHNFNTTNVGAVVIDATGTKEGVVTTWTNPTVNTTTINFGAVPASAGDYIVMLFAKQGDNT